MKSQNKLLMLRKKSGMTQTDAAVAIGVSLGGYRLWESGGGRPTYENRKKISELFKIPIDNIFTDLVG
jgi:DNA-binding XRE family transcriptional regulator